MPDISELSWKSVTSPENYWINGFIEIKCTAFTRVTCSGPHWPKIVGAFSFSWHQTSALCAAVEITFGLLYWSSDFPSTLENYPEAKLLVLSDEKFVKE
ncbi:hypothetical protein CEXT_688611 [Caerostris extrusa]|uniref:Uncharacterized protein n=1 Tax=Caerostris extrusa TaxID=172846 RepID=A0AAV4SN46_CAEEX|nr:hypothetical protein CEXT_688611 [Caerostris extrusa]